MTMQPSRVTGEELVGHAPLGRRDGSGAPSLISIEHMSKRYMTRGGDEVVALDDIELEVADGEFVTVVGPSGCGKTTLLKILAGLLPITSGRVVLDGTPVTEPRRDIALVFQTPVLLPWRTVLDNVMLPMEVQRRPRDEARARELVQLVGLDGFEDKYPFELSGGMQQRNSIVRALMVDPSILLMDEPFGALDAMTREQMNVELQRIWLETGKTVVFITHSIQEAVYLGDRVVVLTPRPGRIAKIFPVELPRPRGLEVMSEPEFGRVVQEIRSCFDAKGGLD
jgi:NitT/TauT family transport system ATP-binding protein